MDNPPQNSFLQAGIPLPAKNNESVSAIRIKLRAAKGVGSNCANFQKGCAASRQTVLSEELATESSIFPEQLPPSCRLDTRAVPSDTRAVSPDTRAVFSDKRAVFSDTSAVFSDTRAVSFNTRAVPSDTRAVFSNTSTVFSDTRAVFSDTRAVLSTRELCPPTRGLCPPTPKLCPTTREMCPPTRDFAYRHESCQACHVAIGNTTVVSTVCNRNWGKHVKTTTYTCGTCMMCITKTSAT